jgi:O-acetyl-ADP-ribose deacetylase (regulator of RNase III)
MKIVKGDLVKAVLNSSEDEPQVMLHVCNNKGVMGSGIALQVKNLIPDAYYTYKEFESGFKFGLQLGTISVCHNVINLHAQDGYGRGIRHLDYEALYKCLEKAAVYLKSAGIERVGVPYRMGSDRAGGDWRIVSAMLETVFTYGNNPHITLYVYELEN